MRAFTRHRGRVAVMDRANVDTDQIIPKQFLKRIGRTGFGEHLFDTWRYLEDGSENPDFELNRPAAQGASILLARRNFGCGSSREHAPWALEEYGFRVLIAPSFADIFYNNCLKNGLLPVRLDDPHIENLFERINAHCDTMWTVDLETCRLEDEHGWSLDFEIDPFRRHCLMHGLDDIGLTLEREGQITAYERDHPM